MAKQKVSVKKQQWKPDDAYPLPAVLVSLGRGRAKNRT